MQYDNLDRLIYAGRLNLTNNNYIFRENYNYNLSCISGGKLRVLQATPNTDQ